MDDRIAIKVSTLEELNKAWNDYEESMKVNRYTSGQQVERLRLAFAELLEDVLTQNEQQLRKQILNVTKQGAHQWAVVHRDPDSGEYRLWTTLFPHKAGADTAALVAKQLCLELGLSDARTRIWVVNPDGSTYRLV